MRTRKYSFTKKHCCYCSTAYKVSTVSTVSIITATVCLHKNWMSVQKTYQRDRLGNIRAQSVCSGQPPRAGHSGRQCFTNKQETKTEFSSHLRNCQKYPERRFSPNLAMPNFFVYSDAQCDKKIDLSLLEISRDTGVGRSTFARRWFV